MSGHFERLTKIALYKYSSVPLTPLTIMHAIIILKTVTDCDTYSPVLAKQDILFLVGLSVCLGKN